MVMLALECFDVCMQRRNMEGKVSIPRMSGMEGKGTLC